MKDLKVFINEAQQRTQKQLNEGNGVYDIVKTMKVGKDNGLNGNSSVELDMPIITGYDEEEGKLLWDGKSVNRYICKGRFCVFNDIYRGGLHIGSIFDGFTTHIIDSEVIMDDDPNAFEGWSTKNIVATFDELYDAVVFVLQKAYGMTEEDIATAAQLKSTPSEYNMRRNPDEQFYDMMKKTKFTDNDSPEFLFYVLTAKNHEATSKKYLRDNAQKYKTNIRLSVEDVQNNINGIIGDVEL